MAGLVFSAVIGAGPEGSGKVKSASPRLLQFGGWNPVQCVECAEFARIFLMGGVAGSVKCNFSVYAPGVSLPGH